MEVVLTNLILVRGLPGSGKDALARLLVPNQLAGTVVSNDHYFEGPDGYVYDRALMGLAIESCIFTVHHKLAFRVVNNGGDNNIVVTNTFSQRREMQAFLDLAAQFHVRVHVIDLFDGGLTDEALAARNVHGVPLHTITTMRKRWEHNWKDAPTS